MNVACKRRSECKCCADVLKYFSPLRMFKITFSQSTIRWVTSYSRWWSHEQLHNDKLDLIHSWRRRCNSMKGVLLFRNLNYAPSSSSLWASSQTWSSQNSKSKTNPTKYATDGYHKRPISRCPDSNPLEKSHGSIEAQSRCISYPLVMSRQDYPLTFPRVFSTPCLTRSIYYLRYCLFHRTVCWPVQC